MAPVNRTAPGMTNNKVIIPLIILAALLLGLILGWFLRPGVPSPTNPLPTGNINRNALVHQNQNAVENINRNLNASPETEWKTFTGPAGDFSFQYPDPFSAQFIRPQHWPPTLQIRRGTFDCSTTGSGTQLLSATKRARDIKGKLYCIETSSEGAAGTIYTDYTYTTARGDQLYILTFTLGTVQCANYDEPDQSLCLDDQANFDADAMVDRIIGSVRVL